MGHGRLAFVIDPVNEHTAEGRARREAFESVCLAAGLAPDVVIWDENGDGAANYRGVNAPHTALVCFSDTLAGYVLTAFAREGVSVPGDVSVIGFDSSAFCESTKPRLTSLNQPVEKMAYMATSHLLTLIREIADGLPLSPTVSSIYDCGLDVRDSTAPPRTQ